MIHASYVEAVEGEMTIVMADEVNPLVEWPMEMRQALVNCEKAQ